METRGRRVRSVEKSIELLDCFWKEGRALSLRELEQMTGWAKSTIHGLLASMLDSAVIEQNATDGKYRLGYHLFELGSTVSQGWDVPERCVPHLQKIVDAVGESAYLARLSGNELILVVCEEPHAGFRVVSEVGTRLPLHCSSQGKAILAHLPDYEAHRLLTRGDLKCYTPNTLTEMTELKNELENVRSCGWAQELEEYKLGLKSVAAPIFDSRGDCRYAVGVICMASVSREHFEKMRKEVTAAAKAIALKLSGAGK